MLTRVIERILRDWDAHDYTAEGTKQRRRRDDMNGDTHLRVLGISGSLRKGSFNSGLLRAAEEVAPEPMEVTIFDIKDIPFYNQDVEAQGDPATVTALKSAIRDADALVLATP